MYKLKLTKVHFLKIFSVNGYPSLWQKKLKVFLFLSLPFLALFSCNTTESTDDLKPGRRDYIWTVDTLYLPFNPFTDITGTSPTDLWVCSPGDADKIFYRFNGNSWNNDGIFRTFSPLAISSNNKSDVWSCGLQGKIWSFDGASWNQKYKYSSDYTDLISILNISSTNKYFAGQLYSSNNDYYGIIYKYDGYVFKNINISKVRTAFANIQMQQDGKIFLWGVSNESVGESKYQFYELTEENNLLWFSKHKC